MFQRVAIFIAGLSYVVMMIFVVISILLVISFDLKNSMLQVNPMQTIEEIENTTTDEVVVTIRP